MLCNNRNRSKNPNNQRGVSILMALTLVVIITTIITGVSLTTNYALRRSAVLTHMAQANAYAAGAVRFAENILKIDSFTSQSDSKTEDWTQNLPPYPVEGGQVTGRINELSSRFNLAMLEVNDKFETRVFKRLWKHLGGSTTVANNIITQIQTKEFVSVIGAFRAVGIQDNVIHERSRYFAYLPLNAERLNINFVTPQVFAAYFDLSVSRANDILNEVAQSPIKHKDELQKFAKRQGIANITIDSSKKTAASVIELRFDVQSRFFQIVGECQLGEANATQVVTVDRGRDTIKRLSQRLSKLTSE